MNDDRLNCLFRVARTDKPDTASTEHGFETRLMARIRSEEGTGEPWQAWIWRLVPVFTVIVAVLAVGTLVSEPRSGAKANLYSAIMAHYEDIIITFL